MTSYASGKGIIVRRKSSSWSWDVGGTIDREVGRENLGSYNSGGGHKTVIFKPKRTMQ
jgi:hypothetical protein